MRRRYKRTGSSPSESAIGNAAVVVEIGSDALGPRAGKTLESPRRTARRSTSTPNPAAIP